MPGISPSSWHFGKRRSLLAPLPPSSQCLATPHCLFRSNFPDDPEFFVFELSL